MITPYKAIRTNYETQFLMNLELNDKLKKIQLKKPKKINRVNLPNPQPKSLDKDNTIEIKLKQIIKLNSQSI